MTDIGAVLDLALFYNEQLAFKDIGTVTMWVNEGADVDKDILPAMKEVIEKHGKKNGLSKTGSFSYFTNAVRQRKDGRKLQEQYARPVAPDDPEAIHRKAKMAARTVRHLGIQDAEALRLLTAYEAKYGPVAV